jgi:hypothetical protein
MLMPHKSSAHTSLNSESPNSKRNTAKKTRMRQDQRGFLITLITSAKTLRPTLSIAGRNDKMNSICYSIRTDHHYFELNQSNERYFRVMPDAIKGMIDS